MKQLERIKQIINQEFPDFEIRRIEKMGEGENSKAFIVNGDFIFRFPKSAEIKESFRKEIALLPKIKSSLHLDIPHFDFISKEIRFVGYKIIPGKFLTSKIYRSLKTASQVNIQKILARFLSQLHKNNLLFLFDCGLTVMNYYEEYSDNLERAKQLIFPNIPASKRKIIVQLFDGYLNNKSNFKYNPSLIHNDFSQDHILFENSSGKITGIIDFGDTAIGDPDYDFMYLLDNYGSDFVSGVANFYGYKNDKELFDKLNFFSLANKIQILIGSIQNEEEDDVKEGYKKLKRWFKNYEKKGEYASEN